MSGGRQAKSREEKDRVVHEWPKNDAEVIRATMSTYKGKQYVSLRLYYRADGGDGWHPTKRGLTLGVDHIPELVKAVKALTEAGKDERAGAEG